MSVLVDCELDAEVGGEFADILEDTSSSILIGLVGVTAALAFVSDFDAFSMGEVLGHVLDSLDSVIAFELAQLGFHLQTHHSHDLFIPAALSEAFLFRQLIECANLSAGGAVVRSTSHTVRLDWEASGFAGGGAVSTLDLEGAESARRWHLEAFHECLGHFGNFERGVAMVFDLRHH